MSPVTKTALVSRSSPISSRTVSTVDLSQAPRPLFGLDSIRTYQGPIFVVEGEKCAAALHQLGLAAVSAPGGAQAARKADWSPVLNRLISVSANQEKPPEDTGRPLIIWPDSDEPGKRYAADVALIAEEAGKGDAVFAVTAAPDGMPERDGADIVDWLLAAIGPEHHWDGLSVLPEGVDRDQLRHRCLAAINHALEPVPDTWIPTPAPLKKNVERSEPIPYVMHDKGTFHIKTLESGEIIETKLANFTAQIVEELALGSTTLNRGASLKP